MIRITGFSWGPLAITLWPFILYRDIAPGNDLKNHEHIHARQQLDTLILFLPLIILNTVLVSPWFLLAIPVGGPWWVLYLVEYIYHRMRGKKHYASYRAISAEREAWAHQRNGMYLLDRPFLAQFQSHD